MNRENWLNSVSSHIINGRVISCILVMSFALFVISSQSVCLGLSDFCLFLAVYCMTLCSASTVYKFAIRL